MERNGGKAGNEGGIEVRGSEERKGKGGKKERMVAENKLDRTVAR